ncbi:RIP metalloprotease RseP [Alicyclobacillus sp. SO9]|nr:RIP metalloprotease RseP [Alicyclobacillus sp. SO9]
MVSIIIHEFGHYYVAKRAGVAVPAFSIGFGPKLLKWQRRGTEFSLRLFLIGGMVQLAGEMPQDALFKRGEEVAVRLNESNEIIQVGDKRDVPEGIVGTLRDLDLNERMMMTLETDAGVETYPVKSHAKLMTNARSSMPLVEKHEQVLGKPLWQRAAIILAGPFMNFVLAAVLFSAFFWHTGLPVNQPVLGSIVPSSPAQHAGLQKGDRVLAVDGHKVTSWSGLVTQIQSDKGKPPNPIQLKIQRNNTVRNITVTPEFKQNRPMLGVESPLTYNKFKAVEHGISTVYVGSIQTVHAYGNVIVHHQYKQLSGPVGIADVISKEAQVGVWHVVMITAILSLNLGLFNLLPIPALDGGRLLFMVIEAVRGRAVDPSKEGYIHLVGFALLMLFAVVITYRDVTRLF